jgi:hypothetical protein
LPAIGAAVGTKRIIPDRGIAFTSYDKSFASLIKSAAEFSSHLDAALRHRRAATIAAST